jgi:hypothetical protein
MSAPNIYESNPYLSTYSPVSPYMDTIPFNEISPAFYPQDMPVMEDENYYYFKVESEQDDLHEMPLPDALKKKARSKDSITGPKKKRDQVKSACCKSS